MSYFTALFQHMLGRKTTKKGANPSVSLKVNFNMESSD
jgi:hypothetical protein